VARMIVTRSELVQRKAPTGGDDCFQSTHPRHDFSVL
jgi:hypothetical protein